MKQKKEPVKTNSNVYNLKWSFIMGERYKVDIYIYGTHKKVYGFIPTTFNTIKMSSFLAKILKNRDTLSYSEFKALRPEKMLESEIKEIWNQLKSMGILLNNKKCAEDKGKPNKKTLLSGLDFIVYGCNLKCIYCYSDSGVYHNKIAPLDIKMAKKTIDFYDKNAVPVGSIGVGFEGGEPLLQYRLIREIVEYAERKLTRPERKVIYQIASNGTVFHPRIAEFLKEFNVKISISIDGNRETQNRQRPFLNGKGTFDKIIDNIREYEKAGVKFKGACITVTPNSVDFASQVESLFSLGFKAVFVNFVRSSNPSLIFSRDDAEEIGNQFNCINDGNHALANYSYPIRKIKANIQSQYWCAGGRTCIAVTGDGLIYPCSGFAGIPDYLYGTVRDGFYSDVREKFIANTVQAKEKCRSCWARYLCGGGCNHSAYLCNGRIDEPDPIHCEITKKTIGAAFNYMLKRPNNIKLSTINEEDKHGF